MLVGESGDDGQVILNATEYDYVVCLTAHFYSYLWSIIFVI